MKQEEKQKLQEKANRVLDIAKMSVDDKEFKKAKTHYKEALDIFKKIGWFDQVDVLYKEIKNLDRYETEHLRKLDTEEVLKQQKKEEFEERVSGIIEEQKYFEQKRLALLEDLTPEMKKDLEKAKMLKEKAEKEVSQNKLQRAIGRYKYIIEIYKSIPEEKVDLSDKISEIEKIITDLEAKM